MKNYYFTGQNIGLFFYFYYGKIIKKSVYSCSIDGISFDEHHGYNYGELEVPMGPFNFNKEEAQKNVVRLIFGDLL